MAIISIAFCIAVYILLDLTYLKEGEVGYIIKYALIVMY